MQFVEAFDVRYNLSAQYLVHLSLQNWKWPSSRKKGKFLCKV